MHDHIQIILSHDNFMTGNDSYRAWEYSVQYSQLSSGPITTIITFDPYVNLAGLTGGALYELDIVARGLSDSEDLEVGLLVPIVFHTRTDGEWY